MNRQKWIFLMVSLGLFAGTGGFLNYLHGHQRLGAPAVKTSPSEDKNRLRVELPTLVLDYTSERIEPSKITLDTLPPDTSFGERIYTGGDGFPISLQVVLMGADRTSLHKPQFCLRGSGWSIVKAEPGSVHVKRPQSYDLPVTRLSLVPEKAGDHGGAHGVYIYWFVADNEYTASHWQRMWWMARDVVRTGVLQRWAYCVCFAGCAPGQEDATFERMKKFIAAAAPEFQLTPKPAAPAMTASR